MVDSRKTYKTEGIIIKRINYGEADKILTIFTKNYGKIRVVAKGVRKITSKRKGILELFNRNIFHVVKGKNLDIVAEVTQIGNFANGYLNFEKIGRAYYFSEIVDRLTAERVEEQDVYGILYNFLVTSRKKEITIDELEKRMFKDLADILFILGFINEKTRNSKFDVEQFVENIIEDSIKSKKIMSK